jgi:hypothetical protein
VSAPIEALRVDDTHYALDMHTMKGNAMGLGLDHFRSESARLIPPPTADDPYEDEAFRLWNIKQRSKQGRLSAPFVAGFFGQPMPRAAVCSFVPAKIVVEFSNGCFCRLPFGSLAAVPLQ